MDVVVGDHGVERDRAKQRRPDARPGQVGIVDREEVAGVLVVEAALVDVVPRVHHEIGPGLVRVVGDGAIADVAVGVVAERDESGRGAARLPGGEVALGDPLAPEGDAVMIGRAEPEAREGRRVVEPRLPVLLVGGRAAVDRDVGRAPVLGRGPEDDAEVGRGGIGLPGEDHPLLVRHQPAVVSRLHVGQGREQRRLRARHRYGAQREAAPRHRHQREERESAGGLEQVAPADVSRHDRLSLRVPGSPIQPRAERGAGTEAPARSGLEHQQREGARHEARPRMRARWASGPGSARTRTSPCRSDGCARRAPSSSRRAGWSRSTTT